MPAHFEEANNNKKKKKVKVIQFQAATVGLRFRVHGAVDAAASSMVHRVFGAEVKSFEPWPFQTETAAFRE